MTAVPGDIEMDRPGVPWWIILLAGIAALILGILLVTAPGITTLTLVQFLGFYWFLSGIFSFVEIFINRRNWGWKLLLGVIGILAGLTILRHPITSAVFLPALIVIFVAVEGLIYGVISIIRAFSERSWGLGILGALSIVFGVIILISPLTAVVALPILAGIVAIGGGIAMIIESFRVRAIVREPMTSQPMYSEQIPATGPEDDPDTKTE